jgi:hypothetical protein
MTNVTQDANIYQLRTPPIEKIEENIDSYQELEDLDIELQEESKDNPTVIIRSSS